MKQYISLETLVKPQIGDPFGPALDKIHTAIKEECLKFTNKYDYEEYVDEGHMDQYYSAISKLVKDRLGITVTITSDLHEGSACCYSLMMPRYDVPGLSRYAQDLIQRSNDFSLPLENSLKFIKEHNGEVGTIDYENAKIGGAFSKYKDNYINIDYHKFFYRYDYSPQEITAVLLHELGHIFTYFELSSKVDRSNYLITEIANSLKNKEPASKRKVYILELSKQKMIDKKTAEDLAKEERPLLVGAKLFTSIFKQCMYIENVLKNNQDLNTHDEFGWLHKLLTFLSSDVAKEADNMTIERNVERLVNNNLFLISAKLDLYHKGK